MVLTAWGARKRGVGSAPAAREAVLPPPILLPGRPVAADLRLTGLATALVVVAVFVAAGSSDVADQAIREGEAATRWALRLVPAAAALIATLAVVWLIDARRVGAGRALAVTALLGPIALLLARRMETGEGLIAALVASRALTFAAEPLAFVWLARRGLATPATLGLLVAVAILGYAFPLNPLALTADGAVHPGLLATLLLPSVLAIVTWRLDGPSLPAPPGPPALASVLRDGLTLRMLAVTALMAACVRMAPLALIDLGALGGAGPGRWALALSALGAAVGGIMSRRSGRSPMVCAGVVMTLMALCLLVGLAAGASPVRNLAFHAISLLGSAAIGPLYAAFQARAQPGGRALAAIGPMTVAVSSASLAGIALRDAPGGLMLPIALAAAAGAAALAFGRGGLGELFGPRP